MEPKDRLKTARNELGLTQEGFGFPMDLSQANVRDLESGKVKISTLHALAIENIHGLSAKWLMTGNGPMWDKSVSEVKYPDHVYAEAKTVKPDPIKHKIDSMLEGMNEDQRRDVLKYVEKEKQHAEMKETLDRLKHLDPKLLKQAGWISISLLNLITIPIGFILLCTAYRTISGPTAIWLLKNSWHLYVFVGVSLFIWPRQWIVFLKHRWVSVVRFK